MKILIVTLRRLGDVLLTTPLVRSVRRGFPDAGVDMLVFAGSERILKGNPDIDQVITAPERPSLAETARLVRALWRQYDLAICTQTGDRPTFMTLAAGRRRVRPSLRGSASSMARKTILSAISGGTRQRVPKRARGRRSASAVTTTSRS